jgi:hypothetical protein
MVAVGLAVVSVPIVAVALMSTSAPDYHPLPERQFGDTLILAAVASVGAAIVGGGVGGLLLPTHRTLGPLVAMALAWTTAVALVPWAASATGIGYQAVVFCLDSCDILIDSARPVSGINAIGTSLQFGVMTVVPDLVLLACIWAADRLNRGGSPGGAAVMVALGFAALNWIAFLFGGATMFIPFVTLAIGVVIWASVLRVPAVSPAVVPSPS